MFHWVRFAYLNVSGGKWRLAARCGTLWRAGWIGHGTIGCNLARLVGSGGAARRFALGRRVGLFGVEHDPSI